MTDPIKKITLKDGTVRYRFVIDCGMKPKLDKHKKPVRAEDGQPVMVRDQRCHTFAKLSEARAERARIISERSKGVYVKPSKATVAEMAAAWLAGKRNIKASTRCTYAGALALLTGKVGHIKAQELTKDHLNRAVTELLASGRRVGNVTSKQLSPRSINLALTLLQAVLKDAMRQGHLVRNVVELVERPGQTRKEMSTWTAGQAATFLDATAGHRLGAAWQLTMYGMRRGEVLGLRWSDVDLVAKTLTIRNTRGFAGQTIVEGEPKTERSKRTLPLDDGLVAALTALQLRQMEEAERAGEAYGTCPLCGGAHVVADELGQPYRPDWYGDLFAKLAVAAKLPKIRLHDARHTCGTLMHLRGVATAVISAWLGHASAAFTMKTYVHSQDDALTAAGATLRTALTLPAAA